MSSIKCFIPTCVNSKRTAPNKVYFWVKDCLKKEWCRQANVPFNPKHQYYCCEDHLNLEEDLENYHYWKLMKGRPIIKSTARLKVNSTLQHIDAPFNENIQEPSELEKLLTAEQNITPKYRVKGELYPSTSNALFSFDAGVQCKPSTTEKSTNFNARKSTVFEPNSTNIEISSLTSESPSVPSLFGYTSGTESTDTLTCTKNVHLRQLFLNLIENKPKCYIGIPPQHWWIFKHICDQSRDKVTELHLIVTLFKIKQNDSMLRISEQFQISMSALSNIFANGVESLSNFFQNLVYLPTAREIKRQLPTVFKIRFSNVQCILDAFEIEIQKPSDPLRQAQTWSQYKNCNTQKYLIGCTPNGYVAFISKGYGGRISDKALLERSNLIDILPFNAVVMADRGFKEVETHLMTKGVKLLRPPSVYSGTKPTKQEVILTKVIASLRVHVERVIRRIREFRLLKPHSVVEYSHVGLMDEIVTIACGIINLQGTIIKNT